jgi:hypothetical protein
VLKPAGETRDLVRRDRISFSFSFRVSALIAASRFKAALWLGCVSCQISLVGQRLRV